MDSNKAAKEKRYDSEPVFYRVVLRDEFESRKIRNPSYSLRAFARDLAVSPSRLSEAMSGARGLSVEMARKIIMKMDLPKDSARQFELSVEAVHARSPKQREIASQQLKRLQSGSHSSAPKTLTIVDWITEAVLKMNERSNVETDVESAAHKLGVPTFAVESSLRFLGRLGFLNRTQKFKSYLKDRGHGRRLNVDYSQLLEIAERISSSQSTRRPHSFGEVDLSHKCLLLDPAGAKRARELIRECYTAICRLERSSQKSSVYFLMSQLFTVEKHEETK